VTLVLSAANRRIEDLLNRPLTRVVLIDLKTRSLRKRIWFRVLDRVERGFVDLTIRWVDKVRNGTMAKVLLQILGKLALALEHGMARVLDIGMKLALRASQYAVEWGNHQAHAWRFDRTFWIGLARASETGIATG